MPSLIAMNELIPLTINSLYCQPRVGLFSPANSSNMSTSASDFFYVVLVDLPLDPNFPAPVSPAQIQADGSLLFPYTLADGSQLPDVPPPGIPLVTYALPVWGGRPASTVNGDNNFVFPSAYFGKKDDKHKGTVIVINSPESPTLPFYNTYECLAVVIKSATFPNQYFVGNLVWMNEKDTWVSWQNIGGNVRVILQQGQPGVANNISFQGFLPAVLQATAINAFTTVEIVFAPNYTPSAQGTSTISYLSADITVL